MVTAYGKGIWVNTVTESIVLTMESHCGNVIKILVLRASVEIISRIHGEDVLTIRRSAVCIMEETVLRITTTETPTWKTILRFVRLMARVMSVDAPVQAKLNAVFFFFFFFFSGDFSCFL